MKQILEVPFGEEFAIIARILVVIVFLYMMLLFRSNYIMQKKDGFENRFLSGYAFMFLFLLGYQIVVTILEIVEYFSDFRTVELQQEFPIPEGLALNGLVIFLENLYKPIFILGLIALLILFAAQIYPLEKMLGWKSAPGTKAMLIISATMLLIFIPGIAWTLPSAFILIACFAGVGYGFSMNIAVNVKMALTTTGAIRRRSIMIILASALFYVGFIWVLEIGWADLIWEGFSLDWDIIFGSTLIVISAFLYRSGLTGRISE
ncbi:MAG: hypothetical protein GF364_00625 [Candidatus Lokiarchaeota archaeon]|nr:hypothetical protein [Candidatus Lokiarchaeota archaeon]